MPLLKFSVVNLDRGTILLGIQPMMNHQHHFLDLRLLGQIPLNLLVTTLNLPNQKPQLPAQVFEKYSHVNRSLILLPIHFSPSILSLMIKFFQFLCIIHVKSTIHQIHNSHSNSPVVSVFIREELVQFLPSTVSWVASFNSLYSHLQLANSVY